MLGTGGIEVVVVQRQQKEMGQEKAYPSASADIGIGSSGSSSCTTFDGGSLTVGGARRHGDGEEVDVRLGR